jgi:hypothetical protein
MVMRRAGFAVSKSLHGKSFAETEIVRTPKRIATEIVNARCLRLRIDPLIHFVGRNVPSLERAARRRCANRLSETLDRFADDRSGMRRSDDLRRENPHLALAFEPHAKLRVLTLKSLDCTLEVNARK